MCGLERIGWRGGMARLGGVRVRWGRCGGKTTKPYPLPQSQRITDATDLHSHPLRHTQCITHIHP